MLVTLVYKSSLLTVSWVRMVEELKWAITEKKFEPDSLNIDHVVQSAASEAYPAYGLDTFERTSGGLICIIQPLDILFHLTDQHSTRSYLGGR